MSASDEQPSLDDVWHGLVTAALLGTDRRDPPELPPGPLADAVADAVRPDPAGRLLATVAAVAAARRAAFVPLPPAAGLQPPPHDPRPPIPSAAAATWRTVVAEWPVLEDEWMLTVLDRGWRLAPDVVVEALARHRTDAVRRARVALAAGPIAGWLAEHVPELAARRATVPAEAVQRLPELALPLELAELVALDAHTFVTRLMAQFDGFSAAHRPVLVNLIARCRPEVLSHAADALGRYPSGLALVLSDGARLRARMLAELATPTHRA